MTSEERFTDRVENYVKFRPTYPPEVVQLLTKQCGLGQGALVADVGSGTGIFTSILLAAGAHVWAVEPNEAMRREAEAAFGSNSGFTSVAANAESTSLGAHSVDLVTSAQAFHWFDPVRAKTEFVRILRPGGWLALVWNSRQSFGTPLLEGYERILREFCAEYAQVNHRNLDSIGLAEVFSPNDMRVAKFPYAQLLDEQALIGRALSSSYAPAAGSAGYQPFVESLSELFDESAVDGRVAFEYTTEVFYGVLT